MGGGNPGHLGRKRRKKIEKTHGFRRFLQPVAKSDCFSERSTQGIVDPEDNLARFQVLEGMVILGQIHGMEYLSRVRINVYPGAGFERLDSRNGSP